MSGYTPSPVVYFDAARHAMIQKPLEVLLQVDDRLAKFPRAEYFDGIRVRAVDIPVRTLVLKLLGHERYDITGEMIVCNREAPHDSTSITFTKAFSWSFATLDMMGTSGERAVFRREAVVSVRMVLLELMTHEIDECIYDEKVRPFDPHPPQVTNLAGLPKEFPALGVEAEVTFGEVTSYFTRSR